MKKASGLAAERDAALVGMKRAQEHALQVETETDYRFRQDTLHKKHQMFCQAFPETSRESALRCRRTLKTL